MGRPIRYAPMEITRGFPERAYYMIDVAEEAGVVAELEGDVGRGQLAGIRIAALAAGHRDDLVAASLERSRSSSTTLGQVVLMFSSIS